ncbi:MAG: VOC family protein [Myxococcaceae bacterium]|nr:VOC family protein [Myxococcaceae bacterium]MCI0670239.1 VOC family protein [Myxococcaceae bacterium]
MRLTQVVLFVADLPRMRHFYEATLGLAVVSAEEGFVRLDAGGSVLALHALRGEPPAAIPAVARQDSYLKLCFHTDDVPGTRASLVAAGVTMRNVKTFGAVSFCDGLDPEGNVFQVTTR